MRRVQMADVVRGCEIDAWEIYVVVRAGGVLGAGDRRALIILGSLALALTLDGLNLRGEGLEQDVVLLQFFIDVFRQQLSQNVHLLLS